MTSIATIKTYRFGSTPARALEEGGILAGIDCDHHELDYCGERAKALYGALGAGASDDELTLGRLPDGRWALVGLEVEGHRFAVEQSDGRVECAYCHRRVEKSEHEHDDAPAADDEETWGELAAQHAEGCEWITTRAHRRAA